MITCSNDIFGVLTTLAAGVSVTSAPLTTSGHVPPPFQFSRTDGSRRTTILEVWSKSCSNWSGSAPGSRRRDSEHRQPINMIFRNDCGEICGYGSPFCFVWASMRGAHENDPNSLLFDSRNSWLPDDCFSWFRVGEAKCLLLTKRKWERRFAKKGKLCGFRIDNEKTKTIRKWLNFTSLTTIPPRLCATKTIGRSFCIDQLLQSLSK